MSIDPIGVPFWGRGRCLAMSVITIICHDEKKTVLINAIVRWWIWFWGSIKCYEIDMNRSSSFIARTISILSIEFVCNNWKVPTHGDHRKTAHTCQCPHRLSTLNGSHNNGISHSPGTAAQPQPQPTPRPLRIIIYRMHSGNVCVTSFIDEDMNWR